LQERGTFYSSIFLQSIDLLPAVPYHPLFYPPNANQDSQVRAKPTSFINWNTELSKSAQTFSAAHRDATIMIFSSWETFNCVLDDPVSYGFPSKDVQKQGGSIWIDHLHPTSKMHDIIARDVGAFLAAQSPLSKAAISSAEVSS
jgi:phospholipase/lecithinase/hemolysin